MAEGTSTPSKPIQPGGGRRQGGLHPKGRQVEAKALEEIRALLGERPRHRDLLIEYLHLVQDRYRCLSARHLAALAQEMKLAQAEVYEVATFYAHFDVVRDDEAPPPLLTIRVCDSLTCEIMGAGALLDGLKRGLGERVRVVRAPCVGRCEKAPVAEVGHNFIDNATLVKTFAAVAQGHTHAEIPPYEGIEDYMQGGGYALARDCFAGRRTPEEIIGLLEDSGLRGLGGAGFPTGRKWRFVRQEAAPRLMAVNADEGEPGTFKDRVYLETHPHRFLEGTLIGAWAVEAPDVYIYLRDEYPAVREMLAREIALVERYGLNPGVAIHLRRGAGEYI